MFSNNLQKLSHFANTVKTTLTLKPNSCVRYVPQLQQQQQQQAQRCLSQGFSHRSRTPFSSNNFNKKRVWLVLLPLFTVSCVSASSSSASTVDDLDNMSSSEEYKNAKSIYEFTVKDTHGNDVSLEKYRGQVLLVVNIASQCGLTKNNYKKLTDLKEKFGERGLKILNFPCNQFGSQMPEEDGEAMVCHLRDAKADIGDVFQKVEVNGSGSAPLYQYLKAKQSGTLGSGIKWNFTKFLINKDGIPVDRYAPTTDPMDIAKDIEKLL